MSSTITPAMTPRAQARFVVNRALLAKHTGFLVVWHDGSQWVPDASDVPSVVEGKTLAWIIDLEVLGEAQ